MGTTAPEDQPLMEAGLDSLGAVDLRNALSAHFALELPATFTFDHPTVAAMATHIGAAVAPEPAAAAQPHWRDNALVQHDFGAPTSAAVQLVGLSCVYPGAFPAYLLQKKTTELYISLMVHIHWLLALYCKCTS